MAATTVFLLLTIIALLGGLGLLSPDTAGAAAAEGRGQGEVDVLLGVEADDEGGDVDDLLADTRKTRQSGSKLLRQQDCRTGCDAGG